MEIGGRFRLGALIGRGSSGEVYEGTDAETGARVAIKCVDCRRFRSIAELEAVQEEAALLSSLRHRYIVRLLGVHVTPSAVYFAMEHAGGGTLEGLLQGREGRQLEEPEAQRIFLQIFQALEYCHRRLIVHRDLKSANVLIFSRSDEKADVKVADFGLATLLTPFDGDVSTLAGTPEFMAPELLVTSSCDGAKADLWSLGVMLYEALTGHTPFSGPNLAAILRAALRNDYAQLPPQVSAECRDLVGALLQPDPSRRIAMEAALQHPWLRRGLECGQELSPLPSCEASAASLEQEQQIEEAAAAARWQQADGGPHAGAALGAGSQAAGQASSRPGSGSGLSSGSLGRAPSLRRQHSGRASSLELQLPEGVLPAAGLEPVAEEGGCSPSLSLTSPAGTEAVCGRGRPGDAMSRLARGRSLDTQRRPDGSSPTSRLVKSFSSKSFSISAWAAPPGAAPPRTTGSAVGWKQ